MASIGKQNKEASVIYERSEQSYTAVPRTAIVGNFLSSSAKSHVGTITMLEKLVTRSMATTTHALCCHAINMYF